MKSKKNKQPAKPRPLVIKSMYQRGATNGGRMRDRRLRRPHDARRDGTKILQEE